MVFLELTKPPQTADADYVTTEATTEAVAAAAASVLVLLVMRLVKFLCVC